jgi:hypothetical protein
MLPGGIAKWWKPAASRHSAAVRSLVLNVARAVRVMRKKWSLFFNSSDMWVTDVIVMVGNLELCQTFYRISDPRWSCYTVKFLESTTPELVFQSWSSAKHTPSVS